MKDAESIKALVRDKYGQIAQSNDCGSNCCCGVESTSVPDFTIFADDYASLPGYNSDADLKLGCGLPTEHARIKQGDTVVDLGSGAGNDAFVARAIVGDKGRVIGVDMTEPMIAKARSNAEKLGFKNVEFRLGEIEALPIETDSVDVIVSNCVLNLVPDKAMAFSETYRVLKPGAHFSISDVVLVKPLPEGLKAAAEMYAGCVAGAMLKENYLQVIKDTGFIEVEIQTEKVISIPDDVLSKYLSSSEMEEMKKEGGIILSITVFGRKPRNV